MSRALWNSGLLTGLNALALVVGLVLYPSIAARFSATETDAFFLALAIPWLFIGPAMNALSSTLIPVLAECRAHRPEALRFVVGSALTRSLAASVAATVLIGLLAPIALGLMGRDVGPVEVRLLRLNTLLLLPLISVQTILGVLESASNAAGCFWLPAAAGLLRQVVTLGLIWGLQPMLGPPSLPVAFTLGGLVQVALIGVFWRAVDTPIALSWRVAPDLRTSLRLAVPVLASSVFLQLSAFILRLYAATLRPGSVTAFDYASRVTASVLEVTTSGVLIVILSDWSRRVASGGAEELRERLRGTVPLVLFAILPVVVILHALRRPVVELWLGRPGVDPMLVILVYTTLGYFLIGLVPDIISRVYVRAFLVWQRTRVLAKLAGFRAVLTVVTAYPLLHLLGVPGLALADTIGVILILAGLALLTARHVGASAVGLGTSSAKIALAGAVAWLATVGVSHGLSSAAREVAVPVASFGGLSAYLALAWLLRIDEFTKFWKMSLASRVSLRGTG